jgi:G:T/U-mismatch repair DNA glycosylase
MIDLSKYDKSYGNPLNAQWPILKAVIELQEQNKEILAALEMLKSYHPDPTEKLRRIE